MRPALVLAVLAIAGLPAAGHAQTRIGLALGRSFVGSSGSRVAVPVNDTDALTGGGRAGGFAALQIEAPIASSAFSVRTELSFSQLGREGNAFAFVQSAQRTLPTATVDRSIGISASLVAATSRRARLAPYGIAGIGWYAATLRGPSLDETRTIEARGNGLGMQLGAGLRYRVGGAQLLLETRLIQPMSPVRGTSYTPLMLGVQF